MDKIKIAGKACGFVWTKNKRLIRSIYEKNLVVTSGQNLIAELLTGNGTAPSHLAFGSGTDTPAKSQTALTGTEHYRAQATVYATNNVVTVAHNTTGQPTDLTVGEFGIFNASSGGTMLARFITQQFTLPANASINLIWTLQIGD